MVTKDDQEGIVHTPEGTKSGKKAVEEVDATNDESYKENFDNKSDEGYLGLFPQAAAQRADYELTPDARRIQAERAHNLSRAKQAKKEGDPVPTGEGENPHEDEAPTDVSKHEGDDSGIEPTKAPDQQ
jgi:hypothetical protein